MKETRKDGRKREGGKIQGHVENEVVLRRLKERRPQKKKCLDISWETRKSRQKGDIGKEKAEEDWACLVSE